jgi:hypothetical protein
VTGQRGPFSKPADERVGHHRKLAALPSPEALTETPDPPPGLLPKHRREWFEFWESGDGKRLGLSFLPQVRRLFQLRDQFERAMRVVRKAPMILGSMKQLRTNPQAEYAVKLEAAISRIEGQLARASVMQGPAGPSLEDLNRAVTEQFDPDAEDDPRLAAVEFADQDVRRPTAADARS